MARARKPINAPSRGLSPELKTIALIAVVAAVGFGMYWSSKKDEASDPASGTDAAVSSSGAAAYALPPPGKGPAEAQAVLVKFTDFQ